MDKIQTIIDYYDPSLCQGDHCHEICNDVIQSLWITDSNPTDSKWKICIVDGQQMPLTFNTHNKFWCSLTGKTYKPNEVVWLNVPEYKKK